MNKLPNLTIQGEVVDELSLIGCHLSLLPTQEESDEDLVGLLDESDRKRKSGKSQSSHSGPTAGQNGVRRRDEEDDSDEDLLRV